MEKEPVPFPAAGSSRQLKVRQNRELQKSAASSDTTRLVPHLPSSLWRAICLNSDAVRINIYLP